MTSWAPASLGHLPGHLHVRRYTIGGVTTPPALSRQFSQATLAEPASVTVCCGDRRLRVRPPVDLEREHSDIRRLMRWVRARAAVPGPG